ncbi:MAG: M56 family metallopeptidase [Bacteroidetes bacterium]|nr:M56 family metallopeptidase [Bacteroidota bacterium]
MLQYILNTSAIWLLSLLVFDLFFSKEAYHGFNRAYLLLTFILGLLLPLWSWHGVGFEYAGNLAQPVTERSAAIKDSITNSKAANVASGKQIILLFIYLSGVLVSLVLTVKEAITIINSYKHGNKFKDGVWTIVETGKQHSPYSAFRYVFISSKKDYSDDELRIILTHEEQHGHLLHFFDLLFMQIAKIVCWFHPLVYMYAERLSIVHEYQADAAVDKAPKEYGQFLIEQAILQSAPALSHSFNRSPVKKRIMMLTRNSSSISKSKILLTLPLALVCILCFTKNAFSYDNRVQNGNTVTMWGNTIKLSSGIPDTVIVVDPTNGNESMHIMQRGPLPDSLNGDRIYADYQIHDMANRMNASANTTAGFTDKGIKEYLLTNMKEELKQLKDGSYYLHLDNVVVDKNGAIAYFEYAGLTMAAEVNGGGMHISIKDTIDKKTQDAIARKLTELLHDAPTHIAATVKGEYVPMLVDNTDFHNPFTIKGGKLTAL